LVNSTLLWRETREGVVNRHNRLTEWDLITSHGSTLNKRARSIALSRCRWMRYCQDLLSRDMVAGEYEHQLPDEDYHPYVFSQMKKRMFGIQTIEKIPKQGFCFV
jgi:hypothetical protein